MELALIQLSPEDVYIEHERFATLSEEAKEVITIILDAPSEIVNLLISIPVSRNVRTLKNRNPEKVFCKERLFKLFGLIYGKNRTKEVFEEVEKYVRNN